MTAAAFANFSFQMPTKIVWGPVAEELPEQLAALGLGRVLIVTDPGLRATGLPDKLVSVLEKQNLHVNLYDQVKSNPTTEEVSETVALARQADCDAIVAVGGGSAIDTAKAASMLLSNGGDYSDFQWNNRPITKRSLPMIAVPTTAGTGSEVSKVSVISDPSQPFKKGVLSPLMFAHVALIDPSITVGLPPHLTAATGMDALVHALEAYTGLRANPVSDMLAIESLKLITANLLPATRDGSNIEARSKMMLAALYGGIAMDQAGLGLVHALSGGLCSQLHLHHGLANALILPFVTEFNIDSIPETRRTVLSGVFGLEPNASKANLLDAISSLVTALGLPIGLADRRHETIDLDFDAVAEESMRMVMIHNNPRTVTVEDCAAILESMK